MKKNEWKKGPSLCPQTAGGLRYNLNAEERKRYKDNGILLWTKQAKNGPMKASNWFRAAVWMKKNRVH